MDACDPETTRMEFQLLHTDSRSAARAGVLSTDHGEIRTPIFMPVGTVGSVKGVFHRDLEQEVGGIPTTFTCVRERISSNRRAACTASARGTVRS